MCFEDDQAPFGRMRLATPADNAKLLDLFGDVPMRGELLLTTERAPSFEALYALQAAQTQCWVYELDGRLLGLGTIIWREGYVHGQPTTVAYLGDLRARKEVRGALARFYGKIFNSFCAQTGCQHFYTGILASNAAALKALTARSAHREQQPRYELFRRFDAMQVQFTRRPRPRHRAELRVRSGVQAGALLQGGEGEAPAPAGISGRSGRAGRGLGVAKWLDSCISRSTRDSSIHGTGGPVVPVVAQ